MNSNNLRMGIDLGGTKIEALILDDTGAELARERIPTPSGDYPATLQALADLVTRLEVRVGCRCRVGIGMPGAFSRESGRVKNANSVCLNGQPLRLDLERLLQRPLRFANDADCFTLSEATDGAASQAAVVFGVILGTGTGGGICVNGKLLAGPNTISGEWGHNPLPWPQAEELPGRPCYCGKRGCIETWVSGPGLAQDYRECRMQDLAAEEIFHAAESGEVMAQAAVDRFLDRLARALASVINILDPDCIVLGGGLSNYSGLYEAVPSCWGRYVFSDRVETILVPAKYGDSSGVRGAAWL
ncbi:MAG TPA: ROK family protein [Gammaproteobacteria bacterium]|nr:ROK family protein [Gammaproteobacteria bacterium]